ncbi:hypothetical protein [Deinococcus sp.]|uniref:hypothetical protein n=1 Tax=Deinococcus sp. TaxID=47478 RepID=UPI0025BB924E|nr:hypothetical protein [Deinococcus sp.]
MSNHIRYERDGDFMPSFSLKLDRPGADQDIKGAVVRPDKSTFFAGGDLNGFLATPLGQAQEPLGSIEAVNAQLRRIEKLGKPVVALSAQAVR